MVVVALFNAIAKAKKDVQNEEFDLIGEQQKNKNTEKSMERKTPSQKKRKTDEENSRGWSALKEDLLTKPSLSLKVCKLSITLA